MRPYPTSLSLIIALVAGWIGCTKEFPEAGKSGVFGCKKDSDCLAGFFCQDSKCIKGSRDASSCGIPPWNVEPAAAQDPGSVTPGTAVTITAIGLPSPPDNCSSANAVWWICDAPTGSTFAATDNDGCQHQDNDGSATFTFAPDKAGTYTVELRRSSSVHPVTIVAACEDVAIALSPATTVEPGTAVTASAPGLPAAPDECSFANGSWWVCNAPAGSSHATTENNGCLQQSIGQPNLVFVPDMVGTYDIELRRPAGKVDTSVLTAQCLPASLGKDPAEPVLPFDSVTVTATVGSPPGVCSLVNTEWWVCDAPSDSTSYYTTDNDGCQKQDNDGMSSLHLTPDASGSYRVEVRRGGHVDSIIVEASCASVILTSDDVANQVYTGLEITVTAPGLPSPPSDCSQQEATWWTCPDAQVDCSSVSLSDVCTQHTDSAGQTSMSWRPDTHGSYVVQLCRPGQTDTLEVTALADTLFAEVTYTDPYVVRQIIELQAGDVACRASATSADCGLTSNCVWDEDLQLCWSACNHATDTACNDDHGCDWDTDASTCNSTLSLMLACLMSDNQTDCLLIEKPGTDVSGCQWDSITSLCGVDVDCSDPSYTTEELCEAAGCLWNSSRSECTDASALALPQPTIMQVRADGTEVEPLVFDNENNPKYRFDPNSVFASVGVRAGTGQTANDYGFAFIPNDGAAVIPHTYLFTRPGAADAADECAISQTVVFWRQGNTVGVPSTVETLLETQNNLLTPSDVPTPGLTALVGFPHMLKTSGTEYRVVFGKDPIESTDMSECESSELGDDFFDMAFAVFPFVLAGAPSPINNRLPMQLWVADVNAGGTVIRSTQIASASGEYPCINADDCPNGTATCNSGKCSGVQMIEGYLPRLVDHPSAPGGAVLFSHATCDGGYGEDCNVTHDSVDYDLMIGRLVASPTTQFDAMSFVANDSTLHELDAFLTGDPFGTPSVYYLGMRPVSTNVTTSAGTRPVTVPVYGLYKVSLSFATVTGEWSVTTGPTGLLVGNSREVTAPEFEATPCLLGGEEGLSVTSTWETTNPIHFTMSPDKRYLAYAVATQQLECTSVFSLGPAEDELKPAAPTKSDIYVINIAAAGNPTRIYDEACVDSGPLDDVNVMPIFISDSQQLVFTSRLRGDDPFVNSFFRYNLEDLNESTPGCNVVKINDSDTIKETLTQKVAPHLIPLGASLTDSRSFVKPSCDCRGLSGDTALLAVGLLVVPLLRRHRQRQRR